MGRPSYQKEMKPSPYSALFSEETAAGNKNRFWQTLFTEAAGSPRRGPPGLFFCRKRRKMATWVQHVLSADGWETCTRER